MWHSELVKFGVPLLVLLLLVSLSAVRVFGSKAFHQKRDEVVTREPGQRFLGAPHAAITEAVKDLHFAWMSEAAYLGTPAAKKDPAVRSGTDPFASLESAGWKLWEKFPTPDLQLEFDAAHLRVHVWENQSLKAVCVGFGGTIFNNEKDWRANLRWFLPKGPDEYTAVVRTFAKPFETAFGEKHPDPASAGAVTLYATGHSLGGGLAQQFAYGLPFESQVPRVVHVFAFDPTPVTGFYSVAVKTRNFNKKGLAIDRVYERGEILAILRSLMSFLSLPSAINPVIRQARYNLFPTLNIVRGHSMTELADKLALVVGGKSSGAKA